MVDFSYATGLAALGQGVNNFVNSWNQSQDQQMKLSALGDLGQKVQSGDYAGAAQDAFRIGDAQTGLKLMQLGQAAKGDQAFTQALSQGQGGMSAPAPQSPSAATPG